MKFFFYIIVVLLIALSCENNSKSKLNSGTNKNNKSDSLLISSVNQKKEDIYKYSDTIFVPDISINNLKFVNENSIISAIGNLKKIIREDDGLPYVLLSDKNNRLRLKLVIFPGSGYNDVYQFCVEYMSNSAKENILKTDYNDFITESNIKLGISKLELIKNKGKDYLIEGEVIKYKIKPNTDKNISFLDKYNMPEYYAYYTFKNNYLVKMDFGFLYP